MDGLLIALVNRQLTYVLMFLTLSISQFTHLFTTSKKPAKQTLKVIVAIM